MEEVKQIDFVKITAYVYQLYNKIKTRLWIYIH